MTSFARLVSTSPPPSRSSEELTAEATLGVIRQFGRLLSTFVHYLDDLPVPDEFEAAMAAVAEPRGADRPRCPDRTAPGCAEPAACHEHAGGCGHRRCPPRRPAPVSRRRLPGSRAGPAANPFRHRSCRRPGRSFILGAGHHLAAGDRCPARRDSRAARSGWRPGRRACRCQRPWERDAPAATGLALLTASHCAWVAGATVQAAQRSHPPPPDAFRLLSAIPANFPPPRVAPSDDEQVTRPMSRCRCHCRTAASCGPGIRAPRPLVTGHYLHLMAKRRPGVSDHRPRQRLDPARPHRTSQATRRRPSDLRAAAKRGRRIEPGLAEVASHRSPLRHRQHRHPPGRRPHSGGR